MRIRKKERKTFYDIHTHEKLNKYSEMEKKKKQMLQQKQKGKLALFKKDGLLELVKQNSHIKV